LPYECNKYDEEGKEKECTLKDIPAKKDQKISANSGFGQHGWKNYQGKKDQPAILGDGPMRRNANQQEVHQVFEVSALGIAGVHKDAYLGSVRYGWYSNKSPGRKARTNNRFELLPLAVVSQGTPSSTFLKAAEKWNTTKDKNTLGLPLVDVKVTTASLVLMRPSFDKNPGKGEAWPPLNNPLTLPKGTRVREISRDKSGVSIEVVDGPHVRSGGKISLKDAKKLKDERS